MSNIKDDKTVEAMVEDIETAKVKAGNDAAALGNKQETELPLKKAFLYYRKAIAWSLIICKAFISKSPLVI